MSRPKARSMPKTRKPANAGRAPRQRDVGEIQQGTVGWDDGADHFDLASEGVPLLKVTLFAGHNTERQGQNTNPKRARGLEILARFDGRASDIPPDGELVIVARPAGTELMPGSYYVIGRPVPDAKWTPNRKSGEKIIFGPRDSFIRFKDDGRIFMFVKSGDADTGKPVQVEVSPDGFRVNHPHGEAYADVDGFGLSHSSGAKLSGGACGGLPAPLDGLSSFINLSAAIVRLKAAAVTLGNGGADNLMRATPTTSTLGAMQTAIAALQASVAAVGALAAAATPTPASAAAATAATSALGASATAVTAAGTAVSACSIYGPTQSCLGA